MASPGARSPDAPPFGSVTRAPTAAVASIEPVARVSVTVAADASVVVACVLVPLPGGRTDAVAPTPGAVWSGAAGGGGGLARTATTTAAGAQLQQGQTAATAATAATLTFEGTQVALNRAYAPFCASASLLNGAAFLAENPVLSGDVVASSRCRCGGSDAHDITTRPPREAVVFARSVANGRRRYDAPARLRV